MPAKHPTPLQSLLITGAAGTLGHALSAPLRDLCQQLVLSDLGPPLQARGIQGVACDLADGPAVTRLLKGIHAVLHLGGISVETPFAPIVQANVLGLIHLYEAARLAGTKRIVYASSNHVTGCYGQDELITPQDPARPDGYYGVSKLFGEGLASMYFDRYGIETVCLRIGTATPEPEDRRALSSWISRGDLLRLVTASLTAPDVGFTVAYGVSNNPRSWWRCEEAWARLGYTPQDCAEDYAAKVQHIVFPAGTPMARLQGGSFLGVGPFDDVPP